MTGAQRLRADSLGQDVLLLLIWSLIWGLLWCLVSGPALNKAPLHVVGSIGDLLLWYERAAVSVLLLRRLTASRDFKGRYGVSCSR
jgi:hypothetical protein